MRFRIIGEQQYKEIGDLFYQGIYFQVGMATVMFLLSYCCSPLRRAMSICAPMLKPKATMKMTM